MNSPSIDPGRLTAFAGSVLNAKGLPPARGFDEVFYPDEIEARNEVRFLKEGLRLPEQTLAKLAKLARETGLEALLPF
jgi:LDH2 family malate/lactate/ureidoglycolate dehydrogenase